MKAGRSAALTLGATAATALPAVLLVLAGILDPSQRWGDPFVDSALEVLMPAIPVMAGWVVIRHVPTSPTGPALAWTGGAISLVNARDVIAASDVTEHPLPLAAQVASATTGLWPLELAGVLALLLLFPDGGLRGWAWRLIPWVYGLATVMLTVALWGTRTMDGRLYGEPSQGPRFALMIAGQVLVAACLVAAIASLVVRHRSGQELMRLQVRWLMFAGLLIAALVASGWVMSIGFASSKTPAGETRSARMFAGWKESIGRRQTRT